LSELVSVELASSELPTEFSLDQNYPNPFNPTTVISFKLPVASSVTLVVYSTLGQRVRELVNGDMNAGYQSVSFDATGLSSGLYFYRLSATSPAAGSGLSFVETKCLLLLR
jgi:hypothetical protein